MQLKLVGEDVEALERVRAAVGARSGAEAVRAAVAVLDAAAQATDAPEHAWHRGALELVRAQVGREGVRRARVAGGEDGAGASPPTPCCPFHASGGHLTDKIHPLSLGNVQRSHNQSRMIARKLLKLHMHQDQDHEIASIIDNLKSNLFFHGHPINRVEAKNDLNLKVDFADEQLERLMWELYSQYDEDMQLGQPFSPAYEYDARSRGQQAEHAALTERAAQAAQIAQRAMQEAQVAEQAAKQAPAEDAERANMAAQQVAQMAQRAIQDAQRLAQAAQGAGRSKIVLDKIPGAYIESVGRTDVFLTEMSVERITAQTPIGPQDLIRQEVLWQRWETVQ